MLVIRQCRTGTWYYKGMNRDIDHVPLEDVNSATDGPEPMEEGSVTFCPYSFVSQTYLSFLAITHPPYVIGLLTPLTFIIASFHLLLQTSMTHPCLLIYTSSRFYRIRPCSICFVIIPDFPKSLVYKPSTRYIFP